MYKRQDKKIKVLVSISDGSIVNEEKSRLFSWFSDDDRIDTAKKLAQMNYSILNALEAVELSELALVKEIEVENKQGILYVEVESYGPNGKEEWLVDANTNQLIPMFKK